MSSNKNYVDACVEEALRQAGGNKTKATQLLLAQSMQDKLLEDGLFAHFRESATMYHVQRVAHRLENRGTSGGKEIGDDAFAGMMAQLENNLKGQNPLAAANLKSADSAPVNRTESSPEHGNSLRTLANAFRKKPGSN